MAREEGGEYLDREYYVFDIARTEAFDFPEPGKRREVIIIDFSSPGLPRMEIRMSKAEWSLDKEKELMRKEIDRQVKEYPPERTI